MKKILVGIGIALLGIVFVYAIKKDFSIDSSFLFVNGDNKITNVVSNFNQAYNLSYQISADKELDKEIMTLSKKTTYLLLGEINTQNESLEDYYKRHQDYLKLRYNPKVPKDESTSSGLDESSQEYKDDIFSGFAIPGVFLKFNELGIEYNSFGNIRVSQIDENNIFSVVTLPNVKMKQVNEENPMDYELIKTNLVIYYYFKKLDNEYKLYYLMGETTDYLTDYLSEVESTETTTQMALSPTYDSNIKDIYDYSKLEALSADDLAKIYTNNISNLVTLNAYYNNSVIAVANGFFVNDGLIVTTWNFLEKALIEAQYMTVKDSNGNSYEMAGIVTVNPKSDIAVIKLEKTIGKKVILGDYTKINIEDPVITISSKTGVGVATQTGIMIANDGYIQSLMPLSEADEGSPLFNRSGEVIGMNTSKSTETSTSLAVNSLALQEVRSKFDNLDYAKIKAVSFSTLKEKYYYEKYYDEEIKNNIPTSKWKKYSQIGDLEKNIKLELVKASYKNNIVSLRYYNGISAYIDSMQMASSYKEELVNEGYQEIVSSNTKCIYKNKNYKLIIMAEFNYLIIVMVKL